MNAAQLAWAYIKDRTATTALTVAMLALGVATIIGLLVFADQVNQRLNKDIKGIDLVVGAKGSPLQLILSSVFHLDAPAGNISLTEAEKIRSNPMVSWSVPVGLGDSFQGYRIVGTEQKFTFLYGAELVEGGNFWGTPFDAVLGATVAKRTGLAQGDQFKSAHGLAKGGFEHGNDYVVTGVLKPTGTVIDRLVLTGMQSLWDAHGGHAKDASGRDVTQEVTALLVRYKSPLAAVRMPAFINQQTNMQAAVPAIEAARLFDLMGSGLNLLRGFALMLIVTSVLGIFVALYASLAERRSDIAMLRVMGASPRRVFGQVLMEGVLLALAGALCGVLLGHIGIEIAARLLPTARDSGITGLALLPGELWLVLGTIALGALAALIPAIAAYRTDIAETLARG
jgi:putative ABC transport system permease protein